MWCATVCFLLFCRPVVQISHYILCSGHHTHRNIIPDHSICVSGHIVVCLMHLNAQKISRGVLMINIAPQLGQTHGGSDIEGIIRRGCKSASMKFAVLLCMEE